MQRERFELKYQLDETLACRVREFARSHLELDEAGIGQPGNAYRVNSLYLDSPQFQTFWDWVNANPSRYKLRVRYYEDAPEAPVFFEIKRRAGACILKQRCGVLQKAAALVLAGHFPPEHLILSPTPKRLRALEEWITLATRLHAQPKVLVSYLREAYVDPANEGVRLTLDRQVRIIPRHSCNFHLPPNLVEKNSASHHSSSPFESAPASNTYVQPFDDRVILELKFNSRFPQWFSELVQCFDLSLSAAAKYCEGIAMLHHPEFGHFDARRVFQTDPVAPPGLQRHAPLRPLQRPLNARDQATPLSASHPESEHATLAHSLQQS
jgi:hypothetical protein